MERRQKTMAVPRMYDKSNKSMKGENMLGFYLKNKRLDKKMTITQLSKKSKVSAVSIVKYENDKGVPGIKATEKLAKAYGMSYEQLRKLIVNYTQPETPQRTGTTE